jgi:hypothetical protein
MTSYLSQIRTKAPDTNAETAVHDAIAQNERALAEAEGRHFGRRTPASNPPASKRDVGSAARMIAEPYFRRRDLQPPPRDVLMRRPFADRSVILRRR